MSQVAMNTANGKKEIVDSITSAWNDYVNLAFYLGNNREEKTEEMMQEYEFWKTVVPKVKLGKDGKLIVTGIPREIPEQK